MRELKSLGNIRKAIEELPEEVSGRVIEILTGLVNVIEEQDRELNKLKEGVAFLRTNCRV